jgi:hypothetical protein
MRRALALSFGVATILAAFLLAMGTPNPTLSPEAATAQVLATVLHQTTTPAPLPTLAPTAVHLTSHTPTDGQITSLLAQSSDRGVFLGPSHPVILDRLPLRQQGIEMLVVAGDDTTASNGRWEIPAAFGAILVWERAEYTVKFLRIEHGDTTARVEASLLKDGVMFHFYDMGRNGRDDLQAQRSVIVTPCRAQLRVTVLWGLEQQTAENRGGRCF